MNKKSFYLALAISFAILCGVVSFLVSEKLSESSPASVSPSGFPLDETGSQSGSAESSAGFYAFDSSFKEHDSRQYVISEYDHLIRRIADERGYDWRFISAIAYAESRFDHDVVSHAGAVGLMQIMPVVARQFEVDPLRMSDPHTNIELGVELLDFMGGMLRFPDSTLESDRLSILLAGYNCGMGHVLDARRLAVKYGENPNSWSVVAKYLDLKSEPEYYEDEVVRCGAFYDDRQTLGFVRKVMRYYDSYCEIAML
jgi:membrane-bound lytic murein transglycosylase F